MKDFARLYARIDETTKTSSKVSAMVDYFRTVDAECGAWAIYFLSGQKLSRALPPHQLRLWASQSADLSSWLFEECYGVVGDLAETLSLLIPSEARDTVGSLSEWAVQIRQLEDVAVEDRSEVLTELWKQLGHEERFVFAKLITGSLRVGVSRQLVTRALAVAFDLPIDLVAHRLMGKWVPSAAAFQRLINPAAKEEDLSRPYPFCLAHPIASPNDDLGSSSDYLAEWKWDGIRAQLIRRNGLTMIWSRGEERIEDRFPELIEAAETLPPECVLDGELLAWQNDRPLGFLELQRRINRKQVPKKLMQDVPIKLIAFDLLELDRIDLRDQSLGHRRHCLEALLADDIIATDKLTISQPIKVANWAEMAEVRKQSRERGAEGLMLKKLNSAYTAGRVSGVWWKWKVDPLTIDAVLLYAQRGHGRRSNLYSDYTFGLWDNGQLVPFAKAYSGLTDAEIKQVDRFVRDHTLDKFGPVRSVTPKLVMELAFENVQLSKRHKSGIAVRFPRIVRWRQDKRPEDGNQLQELKRMVDDER